MAAVVSGRAQRRDGFSYSSFATIRFVSSTTPCVQGGADVLE